MEKPTITFKTYNTLFQKTKRIQERQAKARKLIKELWFLYMNVPLEPPTKKEVVKMVKRYNKKETK